MQHSTVERKTGELTPIQLAASTGGRPVLGKNSGGAITGEHRREPSLHFLGRDVFDVRPEQPFVTEGIANFCRSFPVKLIFRLHEQLGSSINCTLGHFVDITHMKMNGRTGATERLRTSNPVFGILVGNHYGERSKHEFRVPNPPRRLDKPKCFGSTKNVFVKLDGRGRIANSQVRKGLENGTGLHGLPQTLSSTIVG